MNVKILSEGRMVLALVALAGMCMVKATSAGELIHESPAPGRDSGRIYYYVPDGIDTNRPAALLVFLHGGDASSPDTAPENYFSEKRNWLMPDVADAPFIVAAPSAPPAPDGSRWNRDGVSRLIDATIAAAKKKYRIDPDRIFLGGHSMGCYGAYHLGQILADRFAGVWTSAGAWWESDFRAFHGTPVYIQHGKLDCSPRREYWGGHSAPRRHHWCGVDFARAADSLMTRYGVEHVYDEHDAGHSLSFPEAKAAMRRFFAWTKDKRRNPYAKKVALVTPCGTKHPDVEAVRRTRWLELLEASAGEIGVDAIVLHGPPIARTEEDLLNQRHTLTKRYWDGSRIVAENLGGNRFAVTAENVKRFAIYLSPEMGDISKSFVVDLGGGRSLTVKAAPVSGDPDYTAKLDVSACAPDAAPIRLGTWNIRLASMDKWEKNPRFPKWEQRMPRVSALIEEKGFDLMGLQEVCTPQADYLRRTFPGWGLVGVATNDAERARTSHANGVFFRKDRFEVEEWGWFGLSETPDVPGVKSWGTMCVRACTWARMKDLADGGRFMIFNTHFDHRSQLAREKGMELILSEIKARNTGRLPVVLLGDFNSVPSSPQVLAAMKKLSWAYKISGTPPKGPYRTDNSWKFVPPEKENAEAGNRIDLIFLTPGTKVFSHETFGDFYGDGLYPSDHFPVKAVIEFKVSK